MTNRNRFPQFSFNPNKLRIERKLIEKKYEDAGKQILLKLGRKRFLSLIEKIRTLANNQKVLKEFATNLKKGDIRLLSYEYPFHDETTETLEKLTNVLIYGYISDVGRTMWLLFQHKYEDKYIHRILQHTFMVEIPSFLGLSDNARNQLNNATKGEENFLLQLVDTMVLAEGKTKNVLNNWKVKEDSNLYRYLFKERLINGIASQSFIHLEGIQEIIEQIHQLTNKDFKRMLINYVSSRSSEDFHDLIMVQSLERFGNPRKDDRPWSFLSNDDFKKVIEWILQYELKKFFEQDTDNNRFIYWRNYLSYLKNLDIIEDPSIISMDFGSFVVVEFGKIGAAYFYHREGFYKVIFPRKKEPWFLNSRNHQKKERTFKEKYVYDYNGIPLYIHDIHHRGQWYSKFDYHMNEFLRGNFDYKY